jgi:hypothetical protein
MSQVFEVALAWTVLNVFNSDIYRPLAIQCVKWLSEVRVYGGGGGGGTALPVRLGQGR